MRLFVIDRYYLSLIMSDTLCSVQRLFIKVDILIYV